MGDLINQLIEKVGLDRETAERVASFFKDNVSEIPRWLQENATKGLLDKLGGGFGDLFGGK